MAPPCTAGQVSSQPMAAGIVPNSSAVSANNGFQVQDCSQSLSYTLLIATGAVMLLVHNWAAARKGRK